MSNSLQPYGLQHAGLPCPSQIPRACSNPGPLSQWCHPTISSSVIPSAFFLVQLSHPYMTTGKTITLTKWTFAGKVISLLFNMLSRLIIVFLPRNRSLLILWLQSSSAVIFEAQENCLSLFPHLFAMKWWHRMLWSQVFECWVFAYFFKVEKRDEMQRTMKKSTHTRDIQQASHDGAWN